jgi:Glu-tRNA(Gln) amidotransferase subunit E-like FAD-binding protein
MYPETDVPSTPISHEWIARLKANLPETQDQLMKRLSEQYSLNQKLAKQLVDSDHLALFEQVSACTKNIQSSFVATMLTETCKSLERDGIPIHTIDDIKMKSIFELVGDGIIAKEAMPDLLKWQTKHLDSDPRDGIKALGIRMLSESELDAIIDRHIERNRQFITEKGTAAFASLMGSVMSEVRGSTDPKIVSEKLKTKLGKNT